MKQIVIVVILRLWSFSGRLKACSRYFNHLSQFSYLIDVESESYRTCWRPHLVSGCKLLLFGQITACDSNQKIYGSCLSATFYNSTKLFSKIWDLTPRSVENGKENFFYKNRATQNWWHQHLTANKMQCNGVIK